MGKNKKVAVVGSGPNGLAAAIRLASAGLEVSVYEETSTIGGSVRSVPSLEFPGISHDWGASSFPLVIDSPAFTGINWAELGVEWLAGSMMFSHAMPETDGFFAFADIDEMVASLVLVSAIIFRKAGSLH